MTVASLISNCTSNLSVEKSPTVGSFCAAVMKYKSRMTLRSSRRATTPGVFTVTWLPLPNCLAQPEWQAFDITLIGRRVTIVQNGTTIIDNQEIPGITGGALDSKEASPGPIYLQGSEPGQVAFRNIVLTPAR
jgi:hypothetical protein